MKTEIELPRIISEREVLQPTERKDACIRKIQVIEYQGKRTENRFWMFANGRLSHIDSIEAQ